MINQFELQKDLVHMYRDPRIESDRDDYMYDSIQNSSFGKDLTSYEYDGSSVTLTIGKDGRNRSDKIREELAFIFSSCVKHLIDGHPECTIKDPDSNINLGYFANEKLFNVAKNCCTILDMSPHESNNFVINLKYYN